MFVAKYTYLAKKKPIKTGKAAVLSQGKRKPRGLNAPRLNIVQLCLNAMIDYSAGLGASTGLSAGVSVGLSAPLTRSVAFS